MVLDIQEHESVLGEKTESVLLIIGKMLRMLHKSLSPLLISVDVVY